MSSDAGTMTGQARPHLIEGLAEIADSFDAVLLDIWGVIHDGAELFAEVPAALDGLRAAGKQVAFLSNAPRPADAVRDKLVEMGLRLEAHDIVMSSGEATRNALLFPPGDWPFDAGGRFYHLGPARDAGLYAGIEARCMDEVGKAAFLLVTGLDAPDETVEDYRDILDAGLAAGLPMLCANPDIAIMRGGKRELCAGALAERYAADGGRVVRLGKPYAGVYDAVLSRLDRVERARLLAIGDGPETDIRGARACGLASVLVTGGLHADTLERDGVPDMRAVEDFLQTAGLAPEFVAARLRW